MDKPKFVYVTYIASTPEKVWKALIDREVTGQYWGHSNVSDWKVGSKWEHQRTDGSGIADVVGKVIESTAPRRLVLTWAGKGEKDSRVTFEIESVRNAVRLTLTHEDLPGSEALKGIAEGWPAVLSSLKSFLETGKPLPTWGELDPESGRRRSLK